MEVLNNFGFSPVLLVAQIINFLIILFLLKKLLYKPVISTLKKRKEEIAQGLENAEKARILLEETEENEKKILKQAQERSEKILLDAKNESKEMSNHAIQETRKQVEKMLSDAKSQIDEDIAKAEANLTKNISAVALKLLESSLKNAFDKKDQALIIKKAESKIKSL